MSECNCDGELTEDSGKAFVLGAENDVAHEFEDTGSGRWKGLASATALSLLGVPFVGPGAFRAAWAEVSNWIASVCEYPRLP